MPIVGVSRIAVVMRCRVTVIAGRNLSRNAADEQSTSKGAGTYCANAGSRCDKRSPPDLKGFTFEEQEDFKLLIETGPMVFPYNALHTKTKSTPKNAAERKVPHSYSSRRFAQRSSKILWPVLSPFLLTLREVILRSTVPFLGSCGGLHVP